MSDDYGQSGQTPSQPPAQGQIAPPPPPPPGLFPQQGVGTTPPPTPPYTGVGAQPGYPQPPKKKRGGLIALIIGFVLLCGLGSCAALGVTIFKAGGGDTAKIKLAESHYSAAEKHIKTANDQIDAAKDASKATSAIDAGDKELRLARDEVSASKAAIEGLDSSQGKTDYMASLDEAIKALDAIQDLFAYARTASAMSAKMGDAADTMKKASTTLNAAIQAGNSGKYGTMKSKARSASALFSKANAQFKAASALDPSAGLDKAAAYAAKRKQEADLVAKMGTEGAAGKTSAYNKDIDRMNKLRAEADKIGEPAMISDPNWVSNRIGDLTKAAEAASDKVDTLHAKALKELDYTD
jgi:hypothetical protein